MVLIDIEPGAVIDEGSLLSAISRAKASIYTLWLHSLDAILVLGGGVPVSPNEPPVYVQRRCDVVAELLNKMNEEKQARQPPKVICLSAGTAHLPQYILPQDGLPLWESTACASYLMNHPTYPVEERLLYVETTSYDTISNAFFARSTMTDVAGWRKLLIVTNEFHIHRSKAIFDWIFHVPSEKASSYELYYLACNNVGLGIDALDSRRSHEARGEFNVRSKLAIEYTTLQRVFEFLTTKHDFYTASKLVERASNAQQGKVRDKLLELSYGKPRLNGNFNGGYPVASPMIELRGDWICLSIDAIVSMAFVALCIGICLMVLQKVRACKQRETSLKTN